MLLSGRPPDSRPSRSKSAACCRGTTSSAARRLGTKPITRFTSTTAKPKASTSSVFTTTRRRRTLRHLRRTDGAHLLPGHRAAGHARQLAQLPLGRTAAPAQGVCVRLAAGARRTARRRSLRQRLLPAFENSRRTLPQHAAADARRTAHGPRPGYRNGHGLRIRRRAARIFLALRRRQLFLLARRRQHGPQSVPSDLGRTAPGGTRRPAGKLSRHRLRVALAQRTFVSGRGRRTGAGRSRLRGGVPSGIGPFRRGAERQRTFRGRVVARIHPPHARPSPAERLPRQADHRRLGRRGPTARASCADWTGRCPKRLSSAA